MFFVSKFGLSVLLTLLLTSFTFSTNSSNLRITAADRLAPAVSAAPSSATVPEEHDGGCVDRVEALPESSLYTPDDSRLWAQTLVVVRKGKRRLMLFRGGKLAMHERARGCWEVGLGSGKIEGTKHREGDLKTPEGWYRTSDKSWSKFRDAIAIHYPNALDAERGLRAGSINRSTYRRIVRALRRGRKPPQHTALGGDVLIHGGGGSSDWTLGCVALDDDHLHELRAALPRNKRFDLLILP